MAIALVSGTSKANGGFGPLTSDAFSTIGADLIVVYVGHLNSQATTCIDNQGGNTYTQLSGASRQTGTVSGAIWYIQNPATSATHTITVDDAGASVVFNISALAFSGSTTSAAHTDNGNASSSAATLQPGSATPSEDNCVLCCGLIHNDPSSPAPSIDGGFTIGTSVAAVAATSFGSALAYLIQTTATAANPTWTINPAMYMTVGMSDFKALTGAGTPPAMGGRFHRIVTRPAAYRPGIAR